MTKKKKKKKKKKNATIGLIFPVLPWPSCVVVIRQILKDVLTAAKKTRMLGPLPWTAGWANIHSSLSLSHIEIFLIKWWINSFGTTTRFFYLCHASLQDQCRNITVRLMQSKSVAVSTLWSMTVLLKCCFPCYIHPLSTFGWFNEKDPLKCHKTAETNTFFLWRKFLVNLLLTRFVGYLLEFRLKCQVWCQHCCNMCFPQHW